MSSKNNNKINVPEARAAMDKFKMEAAAEVGVNLKEGYNGRVRTLPHQPRGRLRGRPDGQEDDTHENCELCAGGQNGYRASGDGYISGGTIPVK